VTREDGTERDAWQFADKIVTETEQITAHVRPCDDDLGFIVAMRPPHLLAKDQWTETGLDPADSQNEPIVDYRKMIITASFQADAVLNTWIDFAYHTEVDYRRVKYIRIPQATAWIVAPNTVVDVADGTLVRYDGTGIERDDSHVIEIAAAFAAYWYGTPRNTIEIDMAGILPVFPTGTMVRDSIGLWHALPVRTVVTEQSWDFKSMRTHARTSYDELAFDRIARAGKV
jgi:hypothetical protein